MRLHSFILILALIFLCRGARAELAQLLPDTSRRMQPIEFPELIAKLDSIHNTLPWHLELESSLGVTQTFATSNWVGGPSNSFVWLADVLASADKPILPHLTFNNDLHLQFGQNHSYNTTTKSWLPPLKSADRIRFDTILLQFGHIIDPYAAGSAESQFLDQAGHVDRFFNPAEFTETAGVSHYWLNTPNARVLRQRAGLGFRERYLFRDDSVNIYKTRFDAVVDAGAELVTDVELGSPLTKYGYLSKLTLFQALYNSRAVSTDHRWQTLDIDWDNTFRANVTRILQVSLSWQLVFDEEISKDLRFREDLTLSVAYRFAK